MRARLPHGPCEGAGVECAARRCVVTYRGPAVATAGQMPPGAPAGVER